LIGLRFNEITNKGFIVDSEFHEENSKSKMFSKDRFR